MRFSQDEADSKLGPEPTGRYNGNSWYNQKQETCKYKSSLKMAFKTLTSLLLLPALAQQALGHSFLEKIWANSVEYKAWSPNDWQSLGIKYPSNTPSWYTENVAGYPLVPANLTTRHITCAKNNSPANLSAPITAGSSLTVKWYMAGQPFPRSHHGPVIDYIAACNGPCSKVNPLDLKFVKIAQLGWLSTDGPESAGYWATDKLIDANGTWAIKVPAGLKAGEYVVRNELIALHNAATAIGQGPYYEYGAEFYPQCVSIKVGGAGTKTISGGVAATSFYKGNESSLAINIWASANHADYIVPGPAVWSGA
ncbi:glycoside hydrolase [Polyplosphaeria fusca]|uniref:Glycoside hydrolase n=1 Tax=Polyplosphaeria fusca TaxID=682080 RepID=A0A9P4QL55_9PLEO|nr:glycoside hydrolase [Polyplosphaeria fusca]